MAIQKGIDMIKYGFQHEPLKYLYWFTAGRWVELYFHPFYSRPIWPVTRPVMNVIQIILMIINMLGICRALLKHRWDKLLPLVLALGYFTVIYIPFVAFNRYGYPNMILLILFGSYFVEQLLGYFSKLYNNGFRRRRTVTP